MHKLKVLSHKEVTCFSPAATEPKEQQHNAAEPTVGTPIMGFSVCYKPKSKK
jgi:hypothetical protein